jgi:hypothetical protein
MSSVGYEAAAQPFSSGICNLSGGGWSTRRGMTHDEEDGQRGEEWSTMRRMVNEERNGSR